MALGMFIFHQAKDSFGLVIQSAVAMLLDGPVLYDDWIFSLLFNSERQEMKISIPQLMQTMSSMSDWIDIDEDSNVSIIPHFKPIFLKAITVEIRKKVTRCFKNAIPSF